jgi:hypothetical protein
VWEVSKAWNVGLEGGGKLKVHAKDHSGAMDRAHQISARKVESVVLHEANVHKGNLKDVTPGHGTEMAHHFKPATPQVKALPGMTPLGFRPKD